MLFSSSKIGFSPRKNCNTAYLGLMSGVAAGTNASEEKNTRLDKVMAVNKCTLSSPINLGFI